MAQQIKERNPRNPESTLFRKLTRLLSGPIVNYRRQYPRQFKRRQLDAYRFKSASGQSFKRGEYNPYDSMNANFMANQNRAERYVDFDQMEYTPEIASALDIYADEMTTSSNLQPLLKIKCPNEEIKTVLDVLYRNILNVEFNLFGWCRTMCKFGDFFLYLDIDEKDGIKHAIGLPQHEVERLEGEDKTNPNYVQFQWNSGGMTFENWQIAHFRILGQDKYAPYGTSVLEPARRIWRQLTLMEDAVMAYRIVRSPERRVFYIDVGNINPQDIEQYMQKVMTQMKRNQIVNQDTGRVDLRYNPMSVEEDYFIPVRGDTSSKVESLPGGTYTGDIDDIKYLRDKLFSALKIPASYLSREEGAEEDKTTLAQKDIRFSRTIQRLQRAVVAELEKIGVVHLFTLGYRGADLTSFKLILNNPSKLAELQELEHWRTKFDVASAATEGYFSKRWIADKLFNLSEEEFMRSHREMFYDRKFEALLEKSAEEIAAAGEEGLEAGEGLGPMGELGALDAPDEELGGEELGAEEDALDLGAEEPAEDEGMLLAAPAKRDDSEDSLKIINKSNGSHLTKGAKGHWYMPTKNDGRRLTGRKKNMHSKYSRETASASSRNIWKTPKSTSMGRNELSSLARGIYENKEPIYNSVDENKVLEVNSEIQKLIVELEQKT